MVYKRNPCATTVTRSTLRAMTERKAFMVRLREETERQLSRDLAAYNDIPESEVARRLLIPALQLATRFGLNEMSAELRRLAEESLALGSTSISRKGARAKSKLPLKSLPQKHVRLEIKVV